MIIPRIKEKLQRYPQVNYKTSEGLLEIPAQTSTGFRVWIREQGKKITVGFEGWHEEFTDEEAALKCFAFGLSTTCRLRVFRCLGTDYKWQVLVNENGEWVADSETGLLFLTLWLPKRQRVLRNEIISP